MHAPLLPKSGGGGGTSAEGESDSSKAVQLFWPINDGFLRECNHGFLPVGAIVDRYGYPGGNYVAPKGLHPDQRALAPGSTEKPYNAYRVLKPIPVQEGPAAPAFRQPGLGMQFKTSVSIQRLIDKGFLEKED